MHTDRRIGVLAVIAADKIFPCTAADIHTDIFTIGYGIRVFICTGPRTRRTVPCNNQRISIANSLNRQIVAEIHIVIVSVNMYAGCVAVLNCQIIQRDRIRRAYICKFQTGCKDQRSSLSANAEVSVHSRNHC